VGSVFEYSPGGIMYERERASREYLASSLLKEDSKVVR